ncbi:MAG: TlpA family protein disulfide reductase, partial [Pseudomonadota bacterium]
SRDEALAFIRDVPVEFQLLVENPGPGDSSVQLGNRRGILPYTVLIDADGRLLKTHYGAFPDAESVREWARP